LVERAAVCACAKAYASGNGAAHKNVKIGARLLTFAFAPKMRQKGDIMKYAILTGLVMACGWAAHADAASFDCAKAATPMEKAICASADLSKADDALAGAFKTDLSGLSAAGQAILRADQRAFLAHAGVACGKGDGIDTDCLMNQFANRTGRLGKAVTHLGGWTFVTTTAYRGSDHSLTTPQIDSPAAGAWNAWAKELVQTAYALTDEVSKDGKPLAGTTVTVVMRVTAAAPDLISVVVQSATEDGGMGGSDNRSMAVTWLVRPAHQLTGKDLFDAAKPWATALAPVAQKHLQDNAGETDKTHRIRRLDQAGGDWTITAKGLSIAYDDWNAAETDLSWAELKPYLRQDLPFDRAKIQDASGN